MIIHTLTLAMHILYRSVQAFGPAARAFEYFLPALQRSLTASPVGAVGAMSVRARTLNSKHLKKGDPLPPYTGILRIYNMRYCPYAQRTVLVLNAKKLDYEVVNINLADKPEWLPTKSPLGKVPSIEIQDGVTVYESLVTAEYLDEVYKQRPLQAKDPLRRAQDRMIIEHITPVHTLFFKSVKFPEQIDQDLLDRFFGALDIIQAELNKRTTTFLGGDLPGFVDYMIWPWFERLPSGAKVSRKFEIDPAKYKILLQYTENMKKDPAVSEYLIPDNIYEKFYKGYQENNPQYHFLDDK